MKDGQSYTILKKLKEAKATQIIEYYYQNPKQWNILFDSDDYIDIESFSDYTFSKNEKKLLLESNVIPVYRRSKVADYWVFDLTTKELQKVSDNKIQEPLLSPDASKVAYVFQRNIFVKDLKSRQIKQLTFDGNYQIINGITDWVYEEEFGFVRAFDWSPDSKQVVYMRFDESKVPIFSMDIYGSEVYQFPYMFRYPKAGEDNSKIDLYIVDTATNARKKNFS